MAVVDVDFPSYDSLHDAESRGRFWLVLRPRGSIRLHTRFFFFNDTATTEIYTLSLHDALPISTPGLPRRWESLPASPPSVLTTASKALIAVWVQSGLSNTWPARASAAIARPFQFARIDRKSTRLNSSHANISYAGFCLKKKYIY